MHTDLVCPGFLSNLIVMAGYISSTDIMEVLLSIKKGKKEECPEIPITLMGTRNNGMYMRLINKAIHP